MGTLFEKVYFPQLSAILTELSLFSPSKSEECLQKAGLSAGFLKEL
jgi:hypothetical protein